MAVVGAVIGLGLALVPAAADAAAQCTSPRSFETVPGPMVVPSGADCELFAVRVNGAVTVRPGGNLSVDQSRIGGSLTTETAENLDVIDSAIAGALTIRGSTNAGEVFTLCPTSIGGAVTVRSMQGVDSLQMRPTATDCSGAPITVKGGLEVVKNDVSVLIEEVAFGGPGKVTNNTDLVELNDNSFQGTLACSGNTNIVGAGNTADSRTGQCAAL